MRLVTYDGGKIGVVIGHDTVVDVTADCQVDINAWPPVGINRVIAEFDKFRPILERAATRAGKPLTDVKLESPVPWPSKVVAYPVNYHAHATEMSANYRATKQGFFLKPSSSVSGASEPIVLPQLPGRRIDHECELAIVIGKKARNIRREDWADYVFGYSCLIDVVVRGKEERVFRKAFDTFCPVGPWLITADEVGDPSALQAKLWVNDELRQSANTRDLVLDIPGMVEMAAAVMTLYPGDIIATGTPEGVGPIKHGDRVRIEIERVGGMEVEVLQGTGGHSSAFDQPNEA
jgi:2-keto-4-pentenoate hydratase/2-oxohepta-3-ene-1,7-dioic acid hydratase in catechol pathway